MQILANRLCLIVYSPARQWWLPVSLFISVGIINISFFVIAIPSRLHVNHTFVRAKNVWNPIERSLLAVIDLCLNGYFMWLVKSKLVAYGLNHYKTIYRYNIVMICFSMSLEVRRYHPTGRFANNIQSANTRPPFSPDSSHRPHGPSRRRSVTPPLLPKSSYHQYSRFPKVTSKSNASLC